ncbi:hypothetical protein HMPREF0645_0984 [Hallella bergensis DSM 17361]|uniref:Uncharacterized protein n=1 Tax=Hallella bergensis DSM 17361 TaxID=585502 RepID=D1PVJ9_9BACT|nr:hypothetical protein HMPREF0645_0984 [Hallella bergensis DSM 17361]
MHQTFIIILKWEAFRAFEAEQQAAQNRCFRGIGNDRNLVSGDRECQVLLIKNGL